MAIDVIETSYQNIDVTHLIPNFFQWLFGSALNFQNGSMFGIGFLLALGLITLLIFQSYSFDRAILTSSFITLIVGLLFLRAGWIGNGVYAICIIYFGAGIYYLFSHRGERDQ